MLVMKKMKQLIASILVIAMALSCAMIFPENTTAANTTEIPESVDYDASYSISAYWNERKAPTKAGYVFGGWYTETTVNDGKKYTALKEADLVKVEDLDALENVCAKFVPAYVLSVRAQMQAATENEETRGESTDLRVLSAVDSTSYQNVGFDVLFNKRTPFASSEEEKTVKTSVYKNIRNTDGEINATEVFGSPATHFSVLKIEEIKSKNYEKVIYVTPYWTTMDGTRVEGISKYVRIMDGYTSNQYISVPINLLTGDAVAAGKIQMQYDYQTLNYVGYDTGVLLPKMEINVDSANGIIHIVGNTEPSEDNQFNNVDPESDIYGNVWFQRKTAQEMEDAGVQLPARWDFLMQEESFCDWSENMIDNVEAWHVRY